MAEQSAIINTLIQQVREIDPSLADVLLKMAEEIERLATKVDPPPKAPKRSTVPALPPPPPVITITFELTRTNVILRWVPPTTGFLLYELRRGEVWDTATRLLSTGNNIVSLDPTPVGSTPFLIKTINANGNYSTDFARVDVIVPPIGTFAITAQVIGNGVTLSWTIPESSFAINFFTIFRAEAIVSAQLRGTFFAFQENHGGNFTYGVQAEDIAGNKSPIVSATLDVKNPEDYEIQTTFVSSFAGTITNGKLLDGEIYYNIQVFRTYEEHFTVGFAGTPFASPQAQVDRNFPLWIQPTEPTGSYDEWTDFGVPLANTIIGIDWNFENLYPPPMTFGTSIYYAGADAVWKGPIVNQPTVFVDEVRWVRVIFTFSGASGTSLMKFKSFKITLYVKRENDGGHFDIPAVPDPAGDKIYFKKAFKYVESITVTPETTVEAFVVYDYDADVVGDKYFRVFMWNNAGVRIGGPVSWKARGII